MQMTNDEIIRSYRTAKDKKKQIVILSQLNTCSKNEIVQILKDAGLHPGYTRSTNEPKKVGKKEKGEEKIEPEEPPKVEEIKITELDVSNEEYNQELSFILDQSINPKIKRCEEKIAEINKEIQVHEKAIRALEKRSAVHEAQKGKLEEIYKAIASYIG